MRLKVCLALAACLAAGAAAAQTIATPACQPSPFAKDQWRPTPAWPTQTRAPAPPPSPPFKVETLTAGLEHPWGLAFLPDGRMLVTERPGRMRIIDRDGHLSDPIEGLPPFVVVAAEGLHDVTLDPDFAKNRLIYFSYFAPLPGGANQFSMNDWVGWLKLSPEERAKHRIGVETVARARLSDDGRRLEHVKVILEGSNRRLVFARDGKLLVTSATPAGLGVDADDGPQWHSTPYGKVLRINPDGSAPKDNPWASEGGVASKLYAVGFRDPEGATLDPRTGDLWTIEHGPRGGDELNHVLPGRNYGYPAISYGREYSGNPIGQGLTAKDGMEQPVYFWVPSIAPSGLQFYTGDLFPAWKGDVFVGAQAGKHLIRLVMDGDRVTGEESLLADRCERIRLVRQGPEGALYLLTEEEKGELLRLTPAP